MSIESQQQPEAIAAAVIDACRRDGYAAVQAGETMVQSIDYAKILKVVVIIIQQIVSLLSPQG